MKANTLQVVTKPLSALTVDPNNANTHPERNMAAIKASLTQFGQVEPLVVRPSGVVVGGNGRLEAMRALGWTEASVVVFDGTDAQAAALAIALNRTARLAEWDEAALTAVLQSLEHEDAALLEAAGFTGGELEKMTGQFGVDETGMPSLASGDREPFQQMTFTLHDSQAELVKRALGIAKDNGGAVSDVNENSNGNALAWIAEQALGG